MAGTGEMGEPQTHRETSYKQAMDRRWQTVGMKKNPEHSTVPLRVQWQIQYLL